VPLPSEFLQDQQVTIPAPSAKPADDEDHKEEEEEQEAREGNDEKEKEKEKEKETEKKKSRSARRRDSKRKTKAKHERLGRPIDTGVEEWERSPKAGPTVLATWPHHWVEGNLPSSALCMFCAESITSGTRVCRVSCRVCRVCGVRACVRRCVVLMMVNIVVQQEARCRAIGAIGAAAWCVAQCSRDNLCVRVRVRVSWLN
jgi:hypothetical protein